MKKLSLIIIALFILAGCTPAEPATEPGDEQPTDANNAQEYQELDLDAAKVSMQVPKHFHMEIRRKPNKEPRVYALFGEDYLSNGALDPIIRFTFENKEYEEFMAEEWDAPYFPLENACDKGESPLGEISGCKEEPGGITSYYLTDKMGDIGIAKKYYFERENSDWPQAEVWVDLYTEDFKNKLGENPTYEEMKATFDESQLTPEQKRRVQMAEEIIKSINN
jgi:hypothetical protein